jgi:sugar phosphate permease
MYCLLTERFDAIEAQVVITLALESLISYSLAPQRSYTVFVLSTASCGIEKVAVSMFPSVTAIEAGDKTTASMAAVRHGLVTTISNVTSGMKLFPIRLGDAYP